MHLRVTPLECQELNIGLLSFINKAVSPILTRITAKDLDTFTMDDPSHGSKVAHIMWHSEARLGPVGQSANTFGAHLHFETRVDDFSLNANARCPYDNGLMQRPLVFK